MLLNPEPVQDVKRELAHDVVSTPDARLRQNTVGATFPHAVPFRQPGAVKHSGNKCACISRNLWTQFPLGSVVGDKAPRYRVLRTRPEPTAAAEIISGPIPQGGIACRHETVLNHKFTKPRRVPSTITRYTAAPLVGLSACLIQSCGKRSRSVGSRREKGLPINLSSLS